jgi:hypothetical protein
MSKYLSCAETAKLVRKALGESFPGVKFSVRSSVYSGGASIDVAWVDGPNAKQVEAVAGVFKGAYFDGMIDYKGSCYNMLAGERVRFGADFIFCHRSNSDAAIERAIAAVCRKYAGNIKSDSLAVPTLAAFRKGELWNHGPMGAGDHRWSWQGVIHERLGKVSDRLEPKHSPSAASVIFLGSDRTGQGPQLDAEAVGDA